MKIIDMHIHISKIRENPVTEVLHLMDQYQIDKGVVFPNNEVEPDNRWMAEQIAAHRDRLIPFAWLNPNMGERALREMEQLVEGLGFKGVKFHPLFHSFYPNRPLVKGIAERAISYGIPILVHCGHAPYCTPWQVGEFARMFPKLTVLLDHMGLQVGWVDDAIEMAMRYDNIILGTTAMPFHEKIRQAVNKIGAERVTYGSDAPTIHPLPELDRVRVAGLTEQQLESVLYGNAARILGIKS